MSPVPESFVITGQKFGPITCRLGLAIHGQPPEAVIDIGSDIHLHLADPEDARDLLKAAAEALAILDPPIPYLPAYLRPVPVEWFCTDCGASGDLVPMREPEPGVYLCNESRQCLARQKAKAGAQ